MRDFAHKASFQQLPDKKRIEGGGGVGSIKEREGKGKRKGGKREER